MHCTGDVEGGVADIGAGAGAGAGAGVGVVEEKGVVVVCAAAADGGNYLLEIDVAAEKV